LTRSGEPTRANGTTLPAMLASLTKLHKHNDVIDKRLTDIEVQINKINSKLDHLLPRPTTQAAPIPVDLTDNSADLMAFQKLTSKPVVILRESDKRSR